MKIKLANGWRSLKDDPPEKHQKVLVTNNPAAKDAFGNMSHVWIAFYYFEEDGAICTYDSNGHKIHNLVAWHPLPTYAVKN